MISMRINPREAFSFASRNTDKSKVKNFLSIKWSWEDGLGASLCNAHVSDHVDRADVSVDIHRWA